MNTSPRPRHAFTLVELLVVITIIGILAGLITAAALRARVSAKQAVVKMEIEQLAMALEHYKTEVGEYPPDFTLLHASDSDVQKAAQNDILRHVRKRFPRFRNATSWTALRDHIKQNDGEHYLSVDLDKLDPSSALVFFLGGLPEQNPTADEWIPAGFHQDPSDPFRTGSPRSKPFFEFTRERLKVRKSGNDYIPYYLPSGIEAPYVYFKSRRNEYVSTLNGITIPYFNATAAGTGSGYCLPYLDPPSNLPSPATWCPVTKSRLWRAAGKFQIITAGLDNAFGDENAFFRYSKAGVKIDPAHETEFTPLNDADFDNLTNFAAGTLEDEMQ